MLQSKDLAHILDVLLTGVVGPAHDGPLGTLGDSELNAHVV